MNLDNYYVVNTESEDLSVSIIAGPLSLGKAQERMRDEVIEWLQNWGIADNESAAEKTFDQALRAEPDEEVDFLHVSKEHASIIHGGGYEDRYSIVRYNAGP